MKAAINDEVIKRYVITEVWGFPEEQEEDSLSDRLQSELKDIVDTVKYFTTAQQAPEPVTWWNKVWDACKEGGMQDYNGSGLEQVIHFLELQKDTAIPSPNQPNETLLPTILLSPGV